MDTLLSAAAPAPTPFIPFFPRKKNPSATLPLMAMAAKGVFRSVSTALVRASAARGGVPHLCAPSSAAVGLSTARAGTPTIGQPLLSGPSGNLSPGGTRLMSTWKWDDNIPSWMYGSLQDPEVVFHRMTAEEKEFARLIQLMLNESARKAQVHNDQEAQQIMLKLGQIAYGQRYHQGCIELLSAAMVLGGFWVYQEYEHRKSQMIQLSSNVASNSGDIFADLVEAGKVGGPSIFGWRPFGEGKQLKWKPEWLEEKKVENVKDDDPQKDKKRLNWKPKWLEPKKVENVKDDDPQKEKNLKGGGPKK